VDEVVLLKQANAWRDAAGTLVCSRTGRKASLAVWVRRSAVRCGAISECCRESGRMQVVCGRVGVGVGGCGKGGLSRKRQGPREGGHKGSRR
jgi:hypothetical protein